VILPLDFSDEPQTSICETTPGVQAFSGYVHLPSSMLEGFGGATAYNASMFFWYFESREDPKNAPLSLYLGGGPGATSLTGAVSENGPCYINPDSNSTRLNPWSWNNKVNMLYIDQPVQVGFSYDKLVPSMLDLLTGAVTPSNNESVSSNLTSVTGVLPSQDPGSAANTTANAARILWHFTQIWLQDFPEHESSDDRISIWANSVSSPASSNAKCLICRSMEVTGALEPCPISNPRTRRSKMAHSTAHMLDPYTSTPSA
jgi:hypothetical protein